MDPSNSTPPRLILASASPRRRAYLRQLGYDFKALSPDTLEIPLPGEAAADYALRNAKEKALAVASSFPHRVVVVAADTVVTLAGRIMEKPTSEDDARRMLEALSGNTHQVITGLCVRGRGADGTETQRAFTVATDVEFKTLPANEIQAYIRSGEPMDKAGAYAIQGRAAYMIRQIRGSYTNVVGLPLAELEEVLSSVFGIKPTFQGEDVE